RRRASRPSSNDRSVLSDTAGGACRLRPAGWSRRARGLWCGHGGPSPHSRIRRDDMGTTTIKAADGGSFSAYVAMPPAGKGPGVLCIQEIFGINKSMRDIADMWAGEGYVAVAPDLFWRQEPGVDITDQTE